MYHYFEKNTKNIFLAILKYVDSSCKNEQEWIQEILQWFYSLKWEKLDFSGFVSAPRNLSPNFINLKIAYQYYKMIVCGKLISYEYNNENLDKIVDLQ